ncbi:MAG: hypothetical protein ACJASQ_003697 [Crocinitomicaceae bacterium]|jgi:hypothetical protein
MILKRVKLCVENCDFGELAQNPVAIKKRNDRLVSSLTVS